MGATRMGYGDDKTSAAAAAWRSAHKDMHDEQRQSDDKAPERGMAKAAKTRRSRHCATARVSGTCMTGDDLDEATRRRQ